MSKELWLQEHERLVNEYMDRHPGASWSDACDAIDGRAVDQRVADRIADRADWERMLAKERFQ